MGLIKAVILLAIAFIASDIITKWSDKYKDHAYFKYAAPYLKSKCNIVLFVVTLILILL